MVQKSDSGVATVAGRVVPPPGLLSMLMAETIYGQERRPYGRRVVSVCIRNGFRKRGYVETCVKIPEEQLSGNADSESVDLSRGPEWGMVAAARVGTNRLWRLPEGDAAGQRIGYL